MQKNIKISTILFMIVFASCTENSPEIRQYYWQVNKFYDIDKDTVSEKLTLFLQVHDEDGIDDLRTIYLINDKDELFWILNSESWVFKANQEENWIGSNNIMMNDFSRFPAGRYRIIVIDDAGKRDEQGFTLTPDNFSPAVTAFPSLKISNRTASVSDNTDVIWFYDSENILIEEMSADNLSDRMLTIPEKAESVYLYRLDRLNGYGLISGPFRP